MPPKNWEEIERYISRSLLGKKTLMDLRPYLEKHKITVEPYPQRVRKQLLEIAKNGEPLGALFVTNGEEGTIYVDMEGELGVVIPFAFHEIVHSLDASLWNAAKGKPSQEQKKDLIFKSECLAFKKQHLFLEELKASYPDLREFLRNHYPKIPFLNREFLPHEIASLYMGIEKIL